MGDYTIAWLVIAVFAVGGGAATWQLGRGIASFAYRAALVAGVVAFFVAPTPVPQAPDVWAPAFVVAVFELLFQIDGAPTAALISLGSAVLGTVLLCVVTGFVLNRRS